MLNFRYNMHVIFADHFIVSLCNHSIFSAAHVNYEKHAMRTSQVIAVLSKSACKHSIFFATRTKKRLSAYTKCTQKVLFNDRHLTSGPFGRLDEDQDMLQACNYSLFTAPILRCHQKNVNVLSKNFTKILLRGYYTQMLFDTYRSSSLAHP